MADLGEEVNLPISSVLLLRLANRYLPLLLIGEVLRCNVVRMVRVVCEIASLRSSCLEGEAGAAWIYAGPITDILAVAEYVVNDEVIIGRHLTLNDSRNDVDASALVRDERLTDRLLRRTEDRVVRELLVR